MFYGDLSMVHGGSLRMSGKAAEYLGREEAKAAQKDFSGRNDVYQRRTELVMLSPPTEIKNLPPPKILATPKIRVEKSAKIVFRHILGSRIHFRA